MATLSFSSSTDKLSQNVPPGEPAHKAFDPVTLPVGTVLVRYQAVEEIMHPRISVRLRLQLIALWLCVAVGLYLMFHLFGYQQAVTDIASGEHRSIESLNTAIRSEQKSILDVSQSLEQVTSKLTSVTVDTAARLGELDDRSKAQDVATRQLADRLKKIETESVATVVANSSTNIQPAERSQVASQEAVSVSIAQNSGVSPANGVPPLPSNSHIHTPNMNLPLVRGAVVHTNSMNEQDYWLIPKALGPNHVVMVRVFPLAAVKVGNKTGIAVHLIDDGRDYDVTTDGEWVQAHK